MIDNVRVYSSSRPVIPQRLRRSARVYKASGGETTSFGLKDLHSTHADMKIGCQTGMSSFAVAIQFIHGQLSVCFKKYECGLRKHELSIKYVLYVNDQVILTLSAFELQEMLLRIIPSTSPDLRLIDNFNVTQIEPLVSSLGAHVKLSVLDVFTASVTKIVSIELHWADVGTSEPRARSKEKRSRKLICCALFAAVALCSAAPPERHPPAEQEQVADFYDAIFIVPRPDLASLGPTNSHTSTDGTGFGGSGSFSLNLFGILKSALGIGGGYGDGSHTASADTDAASGGPINSDRREEHHSLKSIEEQRVDY
ncbi:hypothetical protein EVAR_78042_1 [Eumeta japonica]|uniref:Uncharacterized protein n=1 Tax=Eumeta variegata TaxID=151549 RepID=A0A4C1T343_EUMVA|nr:hypothetical protein EVAR_78042_1 [Eumeta japonica]